MNDSDEFLKLIPDGLAKTGFLLEHEVTQAFRKYGWSVINNRFYIDDVDGKARELDMVVYRVSPGKEIDVVTTLLISCKKNEQMAFAFMSRERLKAEPNFDWQPVHYWTAQEPLCTYLGAAEWKDDYITSDEELQSQIFDIQRDAFATQLLSLSNASPQNDRLIFESVSGLMKALDHEILVLPSRMKGKRIYIFNLITIVDAVMVDAQFSGKKIRPIEIEDFKYFSRYMVRKRELAARIHFVTKSQLEELITTYSQLAIHDRDFFDSLVDKSYSAITNNESIQAYFAKRLSPRLIWRINSALKKAKFATFEGDIELGYSNQKREEELIIGIPTFDENAINHLNANDALKKSVAKILRENARYGGSFRFDMSVPF